MKSLGIKAPPRAKRRVSKKSTKSQQARWCIALTPKGVRDWNECADRCTSPHRRKRRLTIAMALLVGVILFYETILAGARFGSYLATGNPDVQFGGCFLLICATSVTPSANTYRLHAWSCSPCRRLQCTNCAPRCIAYLVATCRPQRGQRNLTPPAGVWCAGKGPHTPSALPAMTPPAGISKMVADASMDAPVSCCEVLDAADLEGLDIGDAVSDSANDCCRACVDDLHCTVSAAPHTQPRLSARACMTAHHFPPRTLCFLMISVHYGSRDGRTRRTSAQVRS